ncbi:hypothetical protein [Clostridium baratii]|uniref:hypothetical protein n=1 Tax=Clostridium baratii TaxID=1561 RepID=UPI0030CD3DC3
MKWYKNEERIVKNILDIFKIVVAYLIVYIFDFFIDYFSEVIKFNNNEEYETYASLIIILTLGVILFIILLRMFKIRKNVIIKFLLILSILMIILTIDNKYFLYVEHGLDFPKTILPQEIVIKSYLIGYPFVGIFYILKYYNILNLSYYVIPIYITIMAFIMIKISNFTMKMGEK